MRVAHAHFDAARLIRRRRAAYQRQPPFVSASAAAGERADAIAAATASRFD